MIILPQLAELGSISTSTPKSTLTVLQSDATINRTLDECLGNIHAATDGSVVFGLHSIILGQLVDLNFAKFADIADALALQ